MIKRKWLLILFILVTTILLISWAMSAFMFALTAATTYGSTNQATQNSFSQASFGNFSLKEHKITGPELAKLKGEVGVYQPGKNYSQIINGHGTGLQPPTSNDWNTVSESGYIIDNVSYASAPFIVDNSQSPYFPPIGNQGSQPSCVAWSVGYYIATFEEAKDHGWDLTGATWSNGQPTVSYQNKIMSPAFVYNLINNGIDNGSSYVAAMNLICNIGVSSWMNMPFNQNDYSSWPSQAAWTEAPLYRGSSNGYQAMWLTDDTGINNLKNLLASGNLVSISVDSNKFSNLSSNDVWTLDNYNSPQPWHAGTVVGYNDNFSYVESGQVKYGAFKVANSWGIGNWEPVQTGFYWISYATMKQIVQSCCYYFDQVNYQPDLFATFNLNDSARSNCIITVGLGNPSKPIATKSFSNYVLGGNQPFCTNNIVMDISEFKGYVPSLYNQTFFLEVYDTQGYQTNGTIMYFAIGNFIALGTPCPTVKGQNVFLNVTYNPQYQLMMFTNYGTVSPTSRLYGGGAPVTITATSPLANTGERYIWIGWVGSGVGSYTGLSNPASVTMSCNITEQAIWEHDYYLTVSSSNGVSNGTGWYGNGVSAYASVSSTTVAVSNGTQYVFTGWSGDASGTSSTSNAIIMNAPKVATASWQTLYQINPSADSHSVINPSSNTWINAGSSQTFIYSANNGYTTNLVLVDGYSVPITGSYTFNNIQTSHTILVTGVVNPILTTSFGAGGSISPSGPISLNYGGNQTFNITANTDYYIVDVAVNGSSVGAVSTYSFTNVQGPYIISATFAPNPTPTPVPTATPTPTPVPTATPTPTPVPTATPTPTPVPTATPTPTPVPTATPTPTPVPTATPTPTPVPTATPTPTPSPTPTPTNNLTPTANPIAAPNPTITSTSTPTPSPLPTITPTTSTTTPNPIVTPTIVPTQTAETESGIPLIYLGVVVAIIAIATIVGLLVVNFIRKRPKIR